MPHPRILKVLLLGDTMSGKTQLLRGLANQEFMPRHKSTVGADFQTITSEENVTIQIWDTAGNEDFRGKLEFYSKNIALIIYCIDFSAKINTVKIEAEIKECQRFSKNAKVFIVATQVDKLEKVPENIKLFNLDHKVFPTSAKNADTYPLKLYLSDWADEQFILSLSPNYLEVRNKLIKALDASPHLSTIKSELEHLEMVLSDKFHYSSEAKAQKLSEFNTLCGDHFPKSGPSTLKLISELIVILAIPVLVGLIGFGVGFTLGLWAGPGAFLAGIMTGQAAAVSAASLTGASILLSAGLTYSIFKPTPKTTPTAAGEFDTAVRAEFKLNATAV